MKMLLSLLLLCLPLAWSSRVCPLVVVGRSMQPTLHPGQLAMLQRTYYREHTLKRGDVVAFRWKGRVYVKRVHALPGERVLVLRNADYSFPVPDGQQERARRLAKRWPLIQLSAIDVPPGHFFSLGDHMTASQDSRDFGPIPANAILGRVCSLNGSPLTPRAA